MNISLAWPFIKFQQPVFKGNIETIASSLIRFSMLNFVIVALMGVVLRAFPFFDSFAPGYKNILHGHSHFAFGGWVMPALFGLLLKNFPHFQRESLNAHWRNISILLLFSAYGMLITFPLMGYKLVSVFFSTLSIAAGFYFAFISFKALAGLPPSASIKFVKAGLFYMLLASIGPVATGPLIAMGKSGTPLYFDVIYFYLHFQYNGWFLFAILALFYQYLEQNKIKTNGTKVFWLLNIACVPTYFLSMLWHQPAIVFNIIGGAGALVQCFALVYLIKDLRLINLKDKVIKALIHISFVSIAVKIILQFLSAWPLIAALAFQQRNFVIAYLHLVLLGSISSFLIAWIFRSYSILISGPVRTGVALFIIAFVCTELLLVAWPLSWLFHVSFTNYALSMLLLSSLLPVGIGLFTWRFIREQRLSSVKG